MKQFIFIILIFANFLQFFGCTNFESGQSSTGNYEANVRIMDDWKVKKGFEFLLEFVPKARFKVEIFNRSNPKIMFEGEYKEIDEKHHIIFKNIPWDSEKERNELHLKIGIGPDEIGFGQIIKRKFNEEISIISAKSIDENVDENSIIEPKTESEIETEIQSLKITLSACAHQKMECQWRNYYIYKQQINLINKLISINQFIVNGGNSNTMDSEPLIRNAKLNIEKRRLEVNNLMENTRRMYLILIQHQYDWQSREGWAVGPNRPSIPDNLFRSLFPTMSGVQISQTAPATLPSPSNLMGMNTPTNAQIPFPPSAPGPDAPLRTSSTGGIGLPAAVGQPRPTNLTMNTPTNAQIPIPGSAPGAPLRTSTGVGVEIPVAGQVLPILNASPTLNRSISQTYPTGGFLHPKLMKELFPPPNQPSGSQQIRSASTGVDLRSQTVGSSMPMQKQMPLHGNLPQQQNPSQLLLNKMELMEARLRQMGAAGDDGRSQMAVPTAISPHQSHTFGGDQSNLRQIIPGQNIPNPQIQLHPSFATGGSGKELSGGSRGKGKGKKSAEMSLSKHFPSETDQPDTKAGGSKKSRGKGKKTGQDKSAATDSESIGTTVKEIPKKRRSGRPHGQGEPKRRKQKEKQGEGSIPLDAEHNHPIGAIPIRSAAMPNPMMDVDSSHPPSAASARNEGENASQNLMQEGVGESQM